MVLNELLYSKTKSSHLDHYVLFSEHLTYSILLWNRVCHNCQSLISTFVDIVPHLPTVFQQTFNVLQCEMDSSFFLEGWQSCLPKHSRKKLLHQSYHWFSQGLISEVLKLRTGIIFIYLLSGTRKKMKVRKLVSYSNEKGSLLRFPAPKKTETCCLMKTEGIKISTPY